MEDISNNTNNNNQQQLQQLPPGFRFHPTDEELITYYLSNKVSDFQFTTRAVTDVDLKKCEPWDLPGKASMGEKEWYFFSLRDRKYPTGMRTNRATEAGYWKTTGKDKEIYRGVSVLVGMKKTLVFYRGRAPKGEKTNWVMHEYRLEDKLGFKPTKGEWVVCRVFQKNSNVKKPHQQTHPSVSSPPSQDYSGVNSDPNLFANELGDIDQLPNLTSATAAISSPSTLQSYNNINDQHHHHHPMITNNNMMMNWTATAANTDPPPLSNWPLLSTNLSMNSLLLTALQLRGSHHQYPRAAAAANPTDHNYPFILPQQQAGNIININPSQFGNDFGVQLANSTSSSSGILDSVQQQQQGPPLEQAFNLDDDSNIWN